jgi:K+-transporting ATPase KdpF subunit
MMILDFGSLDRKNHRSTKDAEVRKKERQMKRHSKLKISEPTTNYQLPITSKKLPLVIFLVLSLNAILAPAVYAATGDGWERTQAYALGILGLVTLGLVVYLFDVVFRPERY